MTNKKYTLKVVQNDKGLNMTRTNDGFTGFEILGFLELTKNEIMMRMRDETNDNIFKIKRQVVVDDIYTGITLLEQITSNCKKLKINYLVEFPQDNEDTNVYIIIEGTRFRISDNDLLFVQDGSGDMEEQIQYDEIPDFI